MATRIGRLQRAAFYATGTGGTSDWQAMRGRPAGWSLLSSGRVLPPSGLYRVHVYGGDLQMREISGSWVDYPNPWVGEIVEGVQVIPTIPDGLRGVVEVLPL